MSKQFVVYARVSTQRQDLGLDAQMSAAERYAASVGGEIIATYSEKESGAHDGRPQLQKAIAACREKKADLLIAKLDRLSRNARFLFELKESLNAAKVGVIAADAPELLQNTLSLAVMAGMAQREREMISERTKAALQALKARGVHLGRERGCDTSAARAAASKAVHERAMAWNAQHCLTVTALYEAGKSLSEIARIFNAEGKTTPRGSAWTPTAIRRVLVKCGAIESK